MSKLSNCISMLNLLSTGRKYSIKELSEILEVTPRMIRVYKEELDKAGIYIDTIRGPYGGYILKDEIKLPINKSKSTINITKEIQEKYNLLSKAIKEKRKVKIQYYSYNKGSNNRIINPIEFYLYKNNWFICAYCNLRSDIRQFELNRIKDIEILEEYFI